MIFDAFLRTHRTPVLSDDDRAALEQSVARTMRFAPRDIMVREGVPLTQCTLLLEGLVHRYKDTPDGRRQILALHVPGDFLDLHSYPLRRLEHTVAATTQVKVAIVPHPTVRELTAKSTVLTEILWRSTLIDAAINREWLVSVGARPAAVRIAHLLCEMHARLARIGAADDSGYDFPITQIDLADATGLTPVHTNRMLRRLAREGLAEFRDKRVTIFDHERLREFGEFDPSYLFFD